MVVTISPTEELTPRVLILEPNHQLRTAILTLLNAEHFRAEVCLSLDEVLDQSDAPRSTVALVAWQSMQGLLTDERRHQLVALTRKLRLVVMVPRRWARLLEATDVANAVAGLVAKPFEADELLEQLRRAISVPVDGDRATTSTSSLEA